MNRAATAKQITNRRIQVLTDFGHRLPSQAIRKNELAIFCGAGISIGAGIPAARELKKTLIASCTPSSEEVELLVSSDLALETVVDIFSAYTDISPVLDIFEGKQPYLAHLLVTHLVNRKLVRDVGTTNFDRLFESAYGSVSGKVFCLCCEDSHSHDVSLPSLFNIHGSIGKRESIMVRLHDVASGRWNQTIVNSLRHLFSTITHNYVMVMGHSFSDRFDVNPILATFKRERRKFSSKIPEVCRSLKSWMSFRNPSMTMRVSP